MIKVKFSKKRTNSNNSNAKKIQDSLGNIFGSIKDCAEYHGTNYKKIWGIMIKSSGVKH